MVQTLLSVSEAVKQHQCQEGSELQRKQALKDCPGDGSPAAEVSENISSAKNILESSEGQVQNDGSVKRQLLRLKKTNRIKN